MYLVYSEHPKTLVKTPRSIHKTYTEAVKVLKEQVNEYITEFNGYQQVIYLTTLDSAKDYIDSKYFVHISEEHSNRYIVYERKKVVDPGYFRNGEKDELVERMLFSILDLGTVMEDLTEVSGTENNTTEYVKKVNSRKAQAHGNHVKYIEELKAFLTEHRPKYYHE